MKLSDQTMKILKAFVPINPGIQIRPGNKIATMAPTKTVFARAEVDQEFKETFAIANVSRFLSALSLMGTEPDVKIGDKSIEISNGKQKMSYTLSDAGVMVTAPTKEPNVPKMDVEFEITPEQLDKVIKAKAVLGLPEIVVTGTGSKLLLGAADTKNPSSDGFAIEVGKSDKKFNAVFKEENLRLIPGAYKVSLSSKGLSNWKGEEAEYFVAIDQSSKF